MIGEADRLRHARLYEAGELESPVRLFVSEELRRAGWALPRPIDGDGSLREETEGLDGACFPCGAVFVSEAAQARLEAAGMSVRDALAGYVRGKWNQPLRGGAGRPVLAFFQEPRTGGNPSWLAAYTDSDRTFTCLATGRGGPFALVAPEGEPRLGRPVSVDARRLFRELRRAKLSGRELAQGADLPEGLVHRLEGSWRRPDTWTDLLHVRKMARALDVPPEALIRGGDRRP